MREFFGLIMFLVLLCIWSLVFAEPKINSHAVTQTSQIPVEKVVQN